MTTYLQPLLMQPTVETTDAPALPVSAARIEAFTSAIERLSKKTYVDENLDNPNFDRTYGLIFKHIAWAAKPTDVAGFACEVDFQAFLRPSHGINHPYSWLDSLVVAGRPFHDDSRWYYYDPTKGFEVVANAIGAVIHYNRDPWGRPSSFKEILIGPDAVLAWNRVAGIEPLRVATRSRAAPIGSYPLGGFATWHPRGTE